ncbi:hypothetical protein RI129_001992 [Pyrocoelia pectoralis]|uniref:Farnesyl pyrophosphate synthase n=1 Tax=Pyrocoelia pectoralis TaxID=417401 RepID=A0AAN7ZY49_9COLE
MPTFRFHLWNLYQDFFINSEVFKFNLRSVESKRRHFLHKNQHGETPEENTNNIYIQEEINTYMSILPNLVKDLTGGSMYQEDFEIARRFANVLEYNTRNSRKLYSFITIALYKLMEDPNELTDGNVRLANILGWCAELLLTASLIGDDIIDSSKMRRGLPCWYLIKDVGMKAINDAMWIENGIYVILRKYFKNHHHYLPIIELLHEAMHNIMVGQTLDTLTMRDGVPQLSTFTFNTYSSIVKYKTGTLFTFPAGLALYLKSCYDQHLHKDIHNLFLKIGHYFQVQNDYFDCFGDSTIMGKNGTDIECGKCTWLIVEALKRVSQQQRNVLEINYGKPSPEKVNAVRTLYEELNLPKVYTSYQDDIFYELQNHIKKMSPTLPREFFYNVVHSIYELKG